MRVICVCGVLMFVIVVRHCSRCALCMLLLLFVDDVCHCLFLVVICALAVGSFCYALDNARSLLLGVVICVLDACSCCYGCLIGTLLLCVAIRALYVCYWLLFVVDLVCVLLGVVPVVLAVC